MTHSTVIPTSSVSATKQGSSKLGNIWIIAASTSIAGTVIVLLSCVLILVCCIKRGKRAKTHYPKRLNTLNQTLAESTRVSFTLRTLRPGYTVQPELVQETDLECTIYEEAPEVDYAGVDGDAFMMEEDVGIKTHNNPCYCTAPAGQSEYAMRVIVPYEYEEPDLPSGDGDSYLYEDTDVIYEEIQ